MRDDVERDEPLGGRRQGRLTRPPLRAVGRDHQVGGEFGSVGAHVGWQAGAADLLLAFDQELDVQREPAALLDECLGELQHDQDRTLVVRHSSPADHIVVHCHLERVRAPLAEASGRLNVVVPVHEDGRCSRGVQPVGPHEREPVGLDDTAVREREPGCDPGSRFAHRADIGAPAHARDRHILRELGKHRLDGRKGEFVAHLRVHPFSSRSRTSCTPASQTVCMSASGRP